MIMDHGTIIGHNYSNSQVTHAGLEKVKDIASVRLEEAKTPHMHRLRNQGLVPSFRIELAEKINAFPEVPKDLELMEQWIIKKKFLGKNLVHDVVY
jgi:hypothetical protein